MFIKKVEFHNGETVNFVHMNGVKSGTLKRVITEVNPPIAIVDDGENVHKIEIDKIIKVEAQDKAKVEKSEDPDEIQVNETMEDPKPVEFPVDREAFLKLCARATHNVVMDPKLKPSAGFAIIMLSGLLIHEIADAIYGPEDK